MRVGAVLYALGFGAEYAAVRVGRAVKYAALWAAEGIRRFAKALAETAFPGAAQVAKDLFGPIVLFAKGTVSLLIHAHRIRKEQGRIYIEMDGEYDYDEAVEALKLSLIHI